jgi:hypothetical protein
MLQLRQSHAELDLAYDLVQEFATMLRTRTGENLDTWLTKAAASQIPELQSFVLGVERDKAAVRAGLTRPESNGIVEGKINKLKLIKRMGYGGQDFLCCASACSTPCNEEHLHSAAHLERHDQQQGGIAAHSPVQRNFAEVQKADLVVESPRRSVALFDRTLSISLIGGGQCRHQQEAVSSRLHLLTQPLNELPSNALTA